DRVEPGDCRSAAPDHGRARLGSAGRSAALEVRLAGCRSGRRPDRPGARGGGPLATVLRGPATRVASPPRPAAPRLGRYWAPVCLLFERQHLGAAIVGGALVYGLALVAIGGVRIGEIRTLLGNK